MLWHIRSAAILSFSHVSDHFVCDDWTFFFGLSSSVFFPFFMYVLCFVHFQALKMYYKNWVLFFWLGMSENLPLVNRRLNQNLCRFAVRPFQCRSEVDHDFLREFWRISITFGEMKSTIPLRFELIWFFCFQSIWN